MAQVKNALMTTAAVLVTIYILNQFGPTQNIVRKAIAG